jgi:predicted 3-demethylubiquinone-9 3-methyltransferase (glyoxalase superfamily)
MPAITPFLWFNNQAEAAVNFYTKLFENSKAEDVTFYEDASAEVSGQPEGSVMTVAFQLEGQDFIALNGGPQFTFSPAVSFLVGCETREELDVLWQGLSSGGTVLMEVGTYPFSERYGWVQDQFGVSWQLILGQRTQKITPSLLFVGQQSGKAEEAMALYAATLDNSKFENSKVISVQRYGPGEENPEGTVKHATFSLNGQEFVAMDGGGAHAFTFTPAISFMVSCETQTEVDHLWDQLSKDGDENAQQCGWLQDRYGVSWQIVPTVLHELLSDPDPEKSHRTMQAMLKMKKLNIRALRQAAESSHSPV